jgi:RNA polymerase sigma-70 factor (ECF subfamily)
MPAFARDADLLAHAGDPAMFEEFYRRHVQAVTRFATRRCRSADEVAELVSIVFFEALRSARGYDGRRGGARPWLLGIAVDCLADLRGERRRSAEALRRLGGTLVLCEDEQAEIESRIDAERLYPAAERALRKLTAAERELVLLVEREGLSVADAARALGVSPAAGRVRLLRARRRLACELARRPTPQPRPEEVS